MSILCIVQFTATVFLFHKLFTKPTCPCIRIRILDTCLLLLAFLPISLVLFKIQLASIWTLVLLIITLGVIHYLKKYNYSSREVLEHWKLLKAD